MKTLRIKDICDKGSSSLKQKDVENQNGAYPVFGASGLIGKIDTYHQNKDYIAIVKDGSGIGRVTFMPAFSSVIGTLQYILPKEGFNIKYISYCLQSLDLAHYKQGAAIPHIYFRDYGEYEVNVEENPDDQQRIVTYLDAEFAKIEALKANAEKQLQAAKDLFQAALKELLTPKEGWVEKKLGEVCSKIGSGATPKGGKKVYLDNGCSLIRSLNVLYGSFKYSELAHITEEAAEQLKGVTIKENDVLFNITGASIARCCVVPTDVLPARVNQHVSILRVYADRINPFFLSFLLLNPKHQKELLTIGEAGTTRQALTKTDLENHIIEIPNIEMQSQIIKRISELSAKVKALQTNYTETITLCNDLKQALLKKVFE